MQPGPEKLLNKSVGLLIYFTTNVYSVYKCILKFLGCTSIEFVQIMIYRINLLHTHPSGQKAFFRLKIYNRYTLIKKKLSATSFMLLHSK